MPVPATNVPGAPPRSGISAAFTMTPLPALVGAVWRFAGRSLKARHWFYLQLYLLFVLIRTAGVPLGEWLAAGVEALPLKDVARTVPLMVLMPLFFILLYRAVLLERWQGKRGFAALFRGQPYALFFLVWLCLNLTTEIVVLPFRVAGSLLSPLSGILYALPAVDFDMYLSMLLTEAVQGIGWIIFTTIGIGVPALGVGGLAALNRLLPDYPTVMRTTLWLSAIFILPVQLLYATEQFAYNFVMNAQGVWWMEQDLLFRFTFLPNGLWALQHFIVDPLRYMALASLAPIIHAIAWPAPDGTANPE